MRDDHDAWNQRIAIPAPFRGSSLLLGSPLCNAHACDALNSDRLELAAPFGGSPLGNAHACDALTFYTALEELRQREVCFLGNLFFCLAAASFRRCRPFGRIRSAVAVDANFDAAGSVDAAAGAVDAVMEASVATLPSSSSLGGGGGCFFSSLPSEVVVEV